MSLTKYGYSTIGVMSIIAFVFLIAGLYFNNMPLKVLLIAIAVALVIFTLNFFRDPDRTAPVTESGVISPADGKIIVIKEVFETEYLKENCIQISVFMSPLNVHVNRIPVDGVVTYLKYHPGKFIAAFEDKASTENERFYTGITKSSGEKVLYSQISGFVARRIVNELKEGDSVKTGEKFGMIKFGSRVDVFMPVGSKVNVKLGDVVTAGETILAEFVK
ncbi:MAG: phosphatidylserine decarboxylase family protein [Ignavibacteriaceae bacterium]|nr:phosphatidylserine decarboxylase family protein [Ignavibacteriaceae bacterium]